MSGKAMKAIGDSIVLVAHAVQRILFQRRILARSFCLAVSGFFSLLFGFTGTCITA